MTSLAVATVKGGLFAQDATTLSSVPSIGNQRFLVAQILGEKSNLALRQRLIALVGVAPGATATKTFPRVEANVELSGKRVIEQQVLINRATTAADVTEINTDLLTLTSRRSFGANPPANKDGNPLGTR